MKIKNVSSFQHIFHLGQEEFLITLQCNKRIKENFNWEFVIATNQLYASEDEIKHFNSAYHSKIYTLNETPTLFLLSKTI